MTRDELYANYIGVKNINAVLKQQNALLVEALEDSCEYHHLPLVNGWSHKLSTTGKVIRCRLSEKAKQALAQAGEQPSSIDITTWGE